MKKLILGLSLFLGAFGLSACGGNENADNSGTYEIALITDYAAGAIDDRSFTQGAWEGLKQYGDEFDVSYQYYRPTEQSTDGYLNGIQMAVDNGAKVVVCPGYSYESAVFQAQDKYPDVDFILLDGVPQNGDYTEYKTSDNTYSAVFAEEQAGFLAGYAIVMDGERDLGFLGGMAVPAVVKYGYGFIQGAEYAAKELGLDKNEVTIKVGYTGNFEPTPENQTKAAAWYKSGTKVIFSCGGLIINSVTAAAEADGEGRVIGVDVDQSGESETIITSAMKMLSDTVYDALVARDKDAFPGGENVRLGIKEEAVGLPDDFSRFNSFSKEEYEAVYNRMTEDKDGVLSNIISSQDEDGKEITMKDLKAKINLIKIDEIE